MAEMSSLEDFASPRGPFWACRQWENELFGGILCDSRRCLSRSHLASSLKNATIEVIRLNFELAYLFQSTLSSVVWGERGRERKQVRVWALCVLRSHPTSLILPSLTINPSLEKWLRKNSLISLGETKGKKTVKDMYVCMQHLPILCIFWAMQVFFFFFK